MVEDKEAIERIQDGSENCQEECTIRLKQEAGTIGDAAAGTSQSLPWAAGPTAATALDHGVATALCCSPKFSPCPPPFLDMISQESVW